MHGAAPRQADWCVLPMCCLSAFSALCCRCRKLLSELRWGPRYHFLVMLPNGRQLGELGQLVQEGQLKTVIDRVLPLEQARWVGAW